MEGTEGQRKAMALLNQYLYEKIVRDDPSHSLEYCNRDEMLKRDIPLTTGDK